MDRREHSEIAVSDLVIVSLVGLESGHDCSVDPSIEANLPFVVACPSCIGLMSQFVFALSIFHYRLGVSIWLADPHNLHLSIVPSQPNVELLRAKLDWDGDGQTQHLLGSDCGILVNIVVVECLFKMGVVELQIGLEEEVVCNPIGVSELVVAIEVVGGGEELSESLLLDLGEGEEE